MPELRSVTGLSAAPAFASEKNPDSFCQDFFCLRHCSNPFREVWLTLFHLFYKILKLQGK